MSLQEDVLSRGVRSRGLHICVLGIIGSGKTTTTKHLHDVIVKNEGRCEELMEPVEDNPILPLYYKDPNRYAFSMQIKMLTRRFAQQKLAQDYTKNGISCVQDSSVFGDSCFVEMLRGDKIPDVEVDVYSELFTEMAEYMMYPSAVVFLKCAPEIALNRIKHRGRECEAGIPIDYLRSLDEQLNRLSESMKRFTHVIELDVNADMNEEQLQQEAHELYVNICCLRATPILSRLGQ
jgi:deoxyadenosine kinase